MPVPFFTNNNPIALRKAKIAYNFGLSECNRVMVNEYFFVESNSATFRFASPLKDSQHLTERPCSPMRKLFLLRVGLILGMFLCLERKVGGPKRSTTLYKRQRIIESMMGLRPRQGNLRLVFRLFSLMRGLPSIRLR